MCGLGFALLLAWTLTATARRQVSKSGNLLPSAFAGFLGIVLFGWILPILAHFLFGLVAGLLTGGTWRIGALAGFLAGLSGEVVLSALVAEGLVSLESISVAIAQIALLLWVLGIIAASIGGLVGRIMTG
jgi:hypothetical protein